MQPQAYSKASTAQAVEAHISHWSSTQQRIAATVLKQMHAWVDGLEIRVYSGWNALGFHTAQAGYFCGLFPQEDHLRLYFEWGILLSDPQQCLQGNGKQTRYLSIDSPQARSTPPWQALQALVEESLLVRKRKARAR